MAVGPTRRCFLAAVAAGGIGGTAGCLTDSERQPSQPHVVHDDFPEAWQQVDQSSGLTFEERFGPITLRAFEHTLVYEHVGMQQALAETFESVEGSPVTAFFSRLDLRPGIDRLPFGIAHERVMSEIRPGAVAAFRTELDSWGVTDVRREGRDTISIETGYTATMLHYAGQFSVTDDVLLEDGTTEPASGTLMLTARLAVWHDGQDVLMAGGVSPAEPVAEAIKASVPPDVIFAEDPSENETLSADPDTFTEAIETLIVATE